MKLIILTPFLLVWFLFGYTAGALLCLFRWGNRNNFKFATELASWGVLKLMGIRVVYLKIENLTAQRPCVFLGTHQSMLDVMTFGTHIPENVTLVVKKEVRWVPIFNLLMMGSNQFFIDRKNKRDSISRLNQLAQYMREHKVSTAIAPEGTRNRTGEGLLPFKKGGFHLAIEAQALIVPIVSAPLKPLYDWKEKKLRSGTLYIEALDPISTKGLTKDDLEPLMKKTRSEMLKVYERLKDRDPFVSNHA